MKIVLKYPLSAGCVLQTVQIPAGAQIIHFADQRGTPTIWALADTTSPPVSFRTIAIVGTGQHFSHDGIAKHAGTILLAGGDFVLHCFELL